MLMDDVGHKIRQREEKTLHGKFPALLHGENIVVLLLKKDVHLFGNAYLNILLEDNSPFRKQDSPFVVSAASKRPLGRFITWHFLREHFEQLKYLVAETFLWGNVILSVTDSFNTKTQLEELRSFKASREGQFDSGEAAILQAIENAETNVKWMKRNFKRISAWLSAHTI